ncbi:MAG: adenosylcobinamide-GDP ribazoletransferase [Nanoarchaeota archaeon]
MNKQIRRLILAISFMTIIPVTKNHKFNEEDLAFSTLYFPFVGFLLGMLSWAIFLILYPYLSLSVTIFLILAFLTFITGALHEDGLADAFDGFGGGYTKARIFEIMKDSRIGTFGSLGLIFLILGKYIFLTEINSDLIPKTIMVALVLSRWSPLPLFKFLKYPEKATGTGKAFISNITMISYWSLILSTIFAFGIVFWFFRFQSIYLIGATILLTFFGYLFFKKKINAITGDCGGAILSLSELLIYFIVMIL